MGDKRDQKRLRRQEANARHKQIADQGTPARSKELPTAIAPTLDHQPFRWTMQSIDHTYAGAWDWQLSGEEVRHLLEVLEDLAGKTWREVKDMRFNSKRTTRQLHHDQPVESIHADAQRRLEHLKLDVESVFRIRHGNLIRIWGYVQAGTFYLVWFDRHHKICPTDN